MCCTVFAYRDTCVCCTYLHVEVRIADRVSNLLKCSACGEHCKCRSKWYLACCSHTCCNAHHIRLSDTAVKKSVREFLLEYTCFCCSSKVCVKNIEVIVLIAKLCKSLAVAFSCSFLLQFCHCLTLQTFKLFVYFCHSLLILLLVRC